MKNLISIEPQSRNTNLADALKRIGLAEKTGRGIDRIFEGSLRYGKLLPDYSESTSSYVRVLIPRSKPDYEFTEMISRASYSKKSFSITELFILYHLLKKDVGTVKSLADDIGIPETRIQVNLDSLIEAELVNSNEAKQYTRYTLNPKKYKKADKKKKSEFVNDGDLLRFIEESEEGVRRKEISDHFSISKDSAYRRLKKLIEKGLLTVDKKGRSTRYYLNTENKSNLESL